jgi:hypothetical protein
MRLTSTGLGIGTSSPAYKLDVSGIIRAEGVSSYFYADSRIGGTNNGAILFGNGTGSNFGIAELASNRWGIGYFAGAPSAGALSSVITYNSAGNLGLGVTPSAWSSEFRVMQVGLGGTFYGRTVAGDGDKVGMSANVYKNTSFVDTYITTDSASKYDQAGGTHIWYTAASGTAGTAISFTTAMSLTAAGELLVGKTSNAVASGAGLIAAPAGDIYSTMTSSTNSAATLNVFSTGAGAYRFYVGLGGTVYATSTTITAISDRRLKENIRDLDEGLATVMALKPRKFDWKEGKGQNIKNARGFIAQEFETVLPDMIEEWRDPAPKGEEPYKAVNANLIPTLVKAIQELKMEFDAYKATHP